MARLIMAELQDSPPEPGYRGAALRSLHQILQRCMQNHDADTLHWLLAELDGLACLSEVERHSFPWQVASQATSQWFANCLGQESSELTPAMAGLLQLLGPEVAAKLQGSPNLPGANLPGANLPGA